MRRGLIGTETSFSKYKILEMPPAFYEDVAKTFVLESAKLRKKASDVVSQIGVVLLVPFLVLVFGWAIAWMLRGFRTT